MDTRKYNLVMVAKVDDHVVAALVTMGRQISKAREKARDVDNIVACGPSREIRDMRRSGAFLDVNEVIATTKIEIAGEGAAFSKNESVRAITQNDITYDLSVINDCFLSGTAQNRDRRRFDEAEIIQGRGCVRGGRLRMKELIERGYGAILEWAVQCPPCRLRGVPRAVARR